MAATKTYIAKTKINFDLKDYLEGSTLELTDEQAAPLLSGGAVELGKGKVSDKSGAPDDEAERLSAIKDAIGKLDKEKTEQWLKDGRPDAKAIEAITGWPVKAADRDAAWDQVKPVE